MNLISRIYIFATSIGAISFVLAFMQQGLWEVSLLILILLGLSLLNLMKSWPGLPHLYFAGMIVTGASGILLGSNPFLLVMGIIAALSAWDLARFLQRLGQAPSRPASATLERHHLMVLTLVGAGSLVLSTVSLSLHISLSLGAAICLGLLLFLGIRYLVNRFNIL